MKWMRRMLMLLRRFVGRPWYPLAIGLLAGLDLLILIIPTDGIMISSVILNPKRWFTFAVYVSLGSMLGAVALSTLVRYEGLPWILHIYPGLNQSETWLLTVKFFESYGLLLVLFISATPLAQQPPIILASLADVPVWEVAGAVLVGRLLKYLILGYIGSHTPRLLNKIWGVKGELDDTGVELK